MAKRTSSRKKRAPRSPVPVLLLLVMVAVAAAWFLFKPAHRAKHVVVSEITTTAPAPARVPQTPAATQTSSPTPLPSESALPSPTSAASVPPRAGNPNAPKLALIIDDCGQWLPTERGFIALDIPVTLSVLPHVHGSATIAQEAHDAGKGVMLHLPMETVSGMDPGPGRVTTEMTDAQITAQVEDDLAQVPLAAGVNNHEGSKASADTRVMNDVIGAIEKHGDLFFIDSRTNAASVGEAIASANGIKTASRDVFLDNKADVAYTEMQLREAARIAKRTGSAIAIGHPKATTLEALKALAPEIQADGIEFVLAQQLTR